MKTDRQTNRQTDKLKTSICPHGYALSSRKHTTHCSVDYRPNFDPN